MQNPTNGFRHVPPTPTVPTVTIGFAAGVAKSLDHEAETRITVLPNSSRDLGKENTNSSNGPTVLAILGCNFRLSRDVTDTERCWHMLTVNAMGDKYLRCYVPAMPKLYRDFGESSPPFFNIPFGDRSVCSSSPTPSQSSVEAPLFADALDFAKRIPESRAVKRKSNSEDLQDLGDCSQASSMSLRPRNQTLNSPNCARQVIETHWHGVYIAILAHMTARALLTILGTLARYEAQNITLEPQQMSFDCLFPSESKENRQKRSNDMTEYYSSRMRSKVIPQAHLPKDFPLGKSYGTRCAPAPANRRLKRSYGIKDLVGRYKDIPAC